MREKFSLINFNLFVRADHHSTDTYPRYCLMFFLGTFNFITLLLDDGLWGLGKVIYFPWQIPKIWGESITGTGRNSTLLLILNLTRKDFGIQYFTWVLSLRPVFSKNINISFLVEDGFKISNTVFDLPINKKYISSSKDNSEFLISSYPWIDIEGHI